MFIYRPNSRICENDSSSGTIANAVEVNECTANEQSKHCDDDIESVFFKFT